MILSVNYKSLNVIDIFTINNSNSIKVVIVFYILFFSYHSEKYRGHVSKTEAPKPLNIILLFIFNKLIKGLGGGQVRGSKGQVRGKSQGVKLTCPLINLLNYKRKIIKGAQGLSYRSALTVFSPVFSFNNNKKNRLYIIIIYYWLRQLFFNIFNQLISICDGSLLLCCFHVTKYRRIDGIRGIG